MGRNGWNRFGGEISEDLVRETGDAFVSAGVRDAGYFHIALDDLWEADSRDSRGRLTWDPAKHPHGIPALAEYVPARGLRFGFYSSAGSHTCAKRPASYGHEEEDARTFAEWGDLLKYDFCHKPVGVSRRAFWQRMGQALRATGRPILFSMCDWGFLQPWRWGASVAGAQGNSCHDGHTLPAWYSGDWGADPGAAANGLAEQAVLLPAVC